MIVKEKGHYRLLSDIKTGNATSVGTIPAGTILEITQIDYAAQKVIGPDLLDWKSWNLPVIPIKEEGSVNLGLRENETN